VLSQNCALKKHISQGITVGTLDYAAKLQPRTQ